MKYLIKSLVIGVVVLAVFTAAVLVANAYSYNHNPSTFGGFPKSGQMRVFYSGPAGVSVELSNYPDSDFFVTSGGREFFDTDINITNTARLQVIIEDSGGRAVGWIPMSSSKKCGSGLPNGNGGNYAITDVSGEYDWVVQNSSGEPLVSKQCWGDWPEWSGDLDFNDFFIIFSYVPQAPVLPTVDIKANGLDGPVYLSSLADYKLTWDSDNANSCASSGSWTGSKSVDGSQRKDNVSQGVYTYVITCLNQYGSATDTVTVNVAPQAIPASPVLSISKQARDYSNPNSGFQEAAYVNPTKEVEFLISVSLQSGAEAKNVYIKDILPSGMSYVSGSATLDGSNVSSDIFSGQGLSLGKFVSGQTKTLKFRARLQDNAYFTQSLTQMTNTAYARGDNASQVQDTATIYAVKQGQVLGAATVDTGADGNTLAIIYYSVFGAASISGFQIGKRFYWKKRIAETRMLATE